jgi:hypothetical protein
MEHRRLKILFAIIALFSFGVIVWYFFFAAPAPAPTLAGTQNPLPVSGLAARLGFIFGGDEAPTSTTETEVTPQEPQAFLRVWDKPATGNTFVTRSYLKEVVATSTSGATTITTSKMVRATTTVLVFVDRGTGHIYGYDTDSGVTYQISNTTIPGVHDAYIWDGGSKVFMRYLDKDGTTVVSTLASIPNVEEGHDAQPLVLLSNLPNNISSVAMSASTKLLSYIVPNDLGASVYTLSSKGSSHTADSSFSQWLLSYGGESLYATTKASAYIEGMTMSLPSFSRIIGEKTGLSVTAGVGSALLGSMWSDRGLASFVSQSGAIAPLSIKTLASKCVASGISFFCGVPKNLPQATEGLPDDWYQGRVSFDDDLMVVQANTGQAYSLYSFSAAYGAMDLVSLSASTKGDLISFLRKQDGSLFLLNTNLLGD